MKRVDRAKKKRKTITLITTKQNCLSPTGNSTRKGQDYWIRKSIGRIERKSNYDSRRTTNHDDWKKTTRRQKVKAKQLKVTLILRRRSRLIKVNKTLIFNSTENTHYITELHSLSKTNKKKKNNILLGERNGSKNCMWRYGVFRWAFMTMKGEKTGCTEQCRGHLWNKTKRKSVEWVYRWCA